MEKITTIGLDLAKSVFQVRAITESGNVAVRRLLRRSQVLDFFRHMEPCLVGIEACGSAHYWANAIGEFCHTVRLMPSAYVKPYVKRNKTDAADAEAICEAVTRPTMRFVPVKSPEEQAAGMVLKTRELLVRQRSQTANALRAHMAELGIIAATGMTSIAKLVAILHDDQDRRLPVSARAALLEMADQIERLTERIEKLDTKIVAAVKADDAARRLTTMPGGGPIIAATVRATVQDPAAFRTGRDLAAWIGIIPRSNSSGGKERVRKISNRGNKQLRTLLIVGATSILKQARRGAKLPAWVLSLMARCPYKVTAVALANKMARTIWALLVKGGTYRAPAIMATP
ncbi:probable insertion sequence transposase protein, IS1111A/IS1328/IS1533 family protein [Stappia aggregata IAM 12614]|uniref:Probable insertion sequence transposase protein, IS1111A/IS1328/IS1533 family protein n=1 Tax=Roseibium aggregatum (strain ATCC 25650 / DSM 13394 / JCM 20685 / NBRC 16684 / NCIMB 2208 / IAM 12614 / B1) TaxID=384765 RepID=A0P2S2_ROSAI|nr:IS110 family transposase [Roseibium aggregatum]EAV40725.1 probable insertion sequence transposase protein, IS1111A/IS1328/IS1533 family protein [Stappia aggregata IAM 12614] [Roseibium aggregatum IAM 12614]